MDVTRDFGFYGDADLKDYLRRPVKILDTDWTVTAGSLGTTFNPWVLFLEDTNVRNRVEGYRLFQGTLHLRFAINGGPFFYGRAIAAYEPRHNNNDHSFGASGSTYYHAQLSMFPHVFLDPTSSEGGEIVCPFLNPDNWIDLIGDSYNDMGLVHLESINDLLHANSSSGTVNVVCYAWMENVRLAAPTTNTYNTYDFQSGPEVLATSAAGLSIVAAAVAWLKHCKFSFQYDGILAMSNQRRLSIINSRIQLSHRLEMNMGMELSPRRLRPLQKWQACFRTFLSSNHLRDPRRS
jgi:hypothetical protein